MLDSLLFFSGQRFQQFQDVEEYIKSKVGSLFYHGIYSLSEQQFSHKNSGKNLDLMNLSHL